MDSDWIEYTIIFTPVIASIAALVADHFFRHQSKAVHGLVLATHWLVMMFFIFASAYLSHLHALEEMIYLISLTALGISLTLANLRLAGEHLFIGAAGLVIYGCTIHLFGISQAMQFLTGRSIYSVGREHWGIVMLIGLVAVDMLLIFATIHNIRHRISLQPRQGRA